jgi:signal transduction histidine kinase
MAQANRTDLDQILDNLIENALAYAPGPITLESGQEDERAYVAIRDFGPGIPADEVGRVTERFYRGRGTPAGGSGLGLAIARDLAEKWGGSLEVSAPDDGGTRVRVFLRRPLV